MNVIAEKCKNCGASFPIDSEDQNFYARLEVPAPTFCPECRMQRRLAWRNERGLSKRKCSAPGHTEDIISIYSDPKLTVYDQEYWWSDAWDMMAYGKEIDFSRPFLAQVRDLIERMPLVNLADSKSTNTSYCNMTVEHKNCYLVSAGWGNEDSAYANRLGYCKETFDSYVCHKLESGYENVQCKASYRLFWSFQSDSCNDSYFLYDCRGSANCVCCTGLRNKQYYIFNQPYTKEEYFKKLKSLRLDSAEGIEEMKKKFAELMKTAIHKYAQILKSTDVSGDNIKEAKNCHMCFDVEGSENSRYCNWGAYGMKDCYDSGPGAGGQSELTYEGVSIGVNNARCSFSTTIWYSHDVHYSYNCHSCEYCFGCVSLRNKKYCILNKQYTKEEYEALLPRVRKQMEEMPYVDKKGRQYAYGEFPPIELSPFAYNDTVAQDFFPLSEAEAREENFGWHSADTRSYASTKRAADLPDSIAPVKDDILKEIIECAHAGKCGDGCAAAFKIVAQELNFYRKFNLPLPRLCFNCRHAARFAKRNPMKLWHRACQCAGRKSEARKSKPETYEYVNTAEHFHGENRCPNEFETTYSPDRPEIVYCEQCYQSEVA